MIERWLRFNAVGLAGIAVQLIALAALKHIAELSVLTATAIAVEIAVLHNFYWHERWTWRTAGTPGMGHRLLRFHLANGLVSIASNLVWMRVLAGTLGIHYLLANGISIAATALINFALSERFVFRPARPPPRATLLHPLDPGRLQHPAQHVRRIFLHRL